MQACWHVRFWRLPLSEFADMQECQQLGGTGPYRSPWDDESSCAMSDSLPNVSVGPTVAQSD